MCLTSKNIILITCNIPNEKILNNIKNILLKKKLVSCINVINNINSFYLWKNKIKNKIEIKIILKSFSHFRNKIIKIIKKIHPYKIPEILIFKINKINKEYLIWMKKTLKNN